MECEAALYQCICEIVKAKDRDSVRDLANKGICYAQRNDWQLTSRARQLWGDLHFQRALTHDNVFERSADMDRALLVSEGVFGELHKAVSWWFQVEFVSFIRAELNRCRQTKSEKPVGLIRCYLDKIKHLEALRDRGDGVIAGRLGLSSQCCIFAKLLWKYNPNFPKVEKIVELLMEHAEICVNLKIWEAAKADIDEVFGYGAPSSSRAFTLAAEVEMNRYGHDLDPSLTLKRRQTALSFVHSGLRVFPNDSKLMKMRKDLEEMINKRDQHLVWSQNPPTTTAQPPQPETPRASVSLEEQTTLAASQRSHPNTIQRAEKSVETKVVQQKKSQSQGKVKRRRRRKTKVIPRERCKPVKEPDQGSGEKSTTGTDRRSNFLRPNEPLAAETAVLRKPASGGGEQRKKAKRKSESKASTALYRQLSAEYTIQYGCDTCTSIQDNKVEWKIVAHRCSATKLLLLDRSGETKGWILVRPCPQSYATSSDPDDLCEHLMKGEECIEKNRCPKPHSKIEKTLWDDYFRKRLGFSKFMEDLRCSPLRVRNELGNICLRYDGRYTFTCRVCFKKGQSELKKAHTPTCSKGHRWKENRLLVFEKTKDRREFVNLDEEHPSDETEGFQKCLKEMLSCGFTEDDVVEESNALIQRRKALSRNAGRPRKIRKKKRTSKYTRESEDEDENPQVLAFADTEVYDEDLEDTMTVWDSDEEFVDNEEEPQEESTSDLYYKMRPRSELWNLLQTDPKKYKRCEIHLEGHFSAKCNVLENSSDDNIRAIEIRGRMNCGPTLDGDEVVVEIKSTEVLDSKREKIKTKFIPKDDQSVIPDKVIRLTEFGKEAKIETRGTVTGILCKTLNRKAYTFLCQVDRYTSHLMKPLDGVAPKIHVKKQGKPNNDSVAVYSMQNGQLHHEKNITLDPVKRANMLFVVRYLWWDPACMYPYGYVTHVIRSGDDFVRSQNVLNILHQVPTKPNQACQEIADGMDPELYISNCKDAVDDRRRLFVFSIDPPNCKDVDDAFSVERIEDGRFRVGVHIADVTSYVEKDDVIDRNARRRTSSYYAATGRVYGLLPQRLSGDVCSLGEGQDRLVLSVLFNVSTKDARSVLGTPEIRRSVIRNRKQMTYEEAETYISNIENARLKWIDEDFGCAVRHLHVLAVQLRADRIREGRFFYQSNDPFDMDYPYESHRMVEEFMLLTNRFIGSFLESKYPGCIPLRVQEPPNEEHLQWWKETHLDTVQNSFYFKQFEMLRQDANSTTESNNVSILMSMIDRLQDALKSGNFKKLRTSIGLESFHPRHLLAMVDWFSIQERAFLNCYQLSTSRNLTSVNASGVETFTNKRKKTVRGHFSLQMEHYVQFTSPIRRYVDMVIHRFVKAALDFQPAPYTSEEVESICEYVNKTTILIKKYDKECKQLKSLQRTNVFQEPFRVPFVIREFDDNSISWTSPYLPHMKRGQRTVNYSNLLVNRKPDIEDEGRKLVLYWERRFYDTIPLSIARTNEQARNTGFLELDTEVHSARVNSETWRRLQLAIERESTDELSDVIETIIEEDRLRKQDRTHRLELTSEMKTGHLLVKHHVKFKQSLKRGTVLNIQVGAECLKGYLQPVCQMLQLTASKDICLQHRRDPVKCFAELATERVSTNYESVEHYQRVWLPIITMEAATQTAAAGDAIFCSNVPVWLIQRNGRYYGTLKLPLDFCRKRQIKIYSVEEEEKDSNDYMCIRFHLTSPRLDDKAQRGDRLWVAHVVSRKNKIEKKTMVYLELLVQHCSGPVPTELLGPERTARHCEVEFLMKSLPDRRMEAAVKAVGSESGLCNSIVLKRRIPPDPEIVVAESTSYDLDTGVANVPRNNASQIRAIRSALSTPFTLIQGPPGTGKTVTGVKLVYWFAKANRLLPSDQPRSQILYCGPSNSSVDVAICLLKKFLGKENLKMVRVYSDILEKQVFPIPRDTSQISLQRGRHYDMMSSDEGLKDIALHNMIRKSHNSYSKEILKYDKDFRENRDTPENVPDTDVEKYLKLVTAASVEELQRYDVIFCTCAASASQKIEAGTNVRQIVIDECGMCMEPESLIPLVCHRKALQVVLIGDHKQLQPIVTNPVARDLGMQKSLFERYQDQAIMLNEQYRMHPSICQFPSQAFYEGKLRTASKLLNELRNWIPPSFWPNSQFPCIVFVHVEGAEKTLSVSTEEGNQQSKSNEAEREEVERIFLNLMNNEDICKDTIAVLSQYKAQCSEIEKSLIAKGICNPRVCTVVASQGGEWEYVILSLVRSLPLYEIERRPSEGWCKRNMGFIVDRHQINVALTRAKRGLIIVGNKHLLRCDDMWSHLLDDYQQRGCVLDVNQFLPDYEEPHRRRNRPRETRY